MKIDVLEESTFFVSVNRSVMEKSDKSKTPGKQQSASRQREPLTEERLKLIRQRIAEGFYDQDEILREVVARLLKSINLDEFLKKKFH
ncbi:MAG: hypothetical protein D6681_11880 [Calditrichaeota bacterium]|nr:MAG: hypothetical protein D6681_11880 [Calditrichota bacterium]